MKHTLKNTALFLALAGGLYAMPEVETIDAAIAQAAAENRTVLVDFTGSDWCTPCMHLKNNIFGSDEFEQAVGSQYVLVSIDYPRKPENLAKVPAEEQQRRQALMGRYRIQAFPTVLLMDAKGKPFSRVEGARHQTAEYLTALAEAQAVLGRRDEALAKAAAAEGLEKAKLLDAAMQIIPENLRDEYPELAEEIMALDVEDTLGYKARKIHDENMLAQGKELDTLLSTFAKRFDKAQVKEDISKIDAFLTREDLVPEIRQAALIAAADGCAFAQDLEGMLNYKKKALEVDQSNPRIVKRLKSDIKYIEEVLIPGLKAEREAQKPE